VLEVGGLSKVFYLPKASDGPVALVVAGGNGSVFLSIVVPEIPGGFGKLLLLGGIGKLFDGVFGGRGRPEFSVYRYGGNND